MKKFEFTIPSSDGRTTLHGLRWEPDCRPIGILQLVHGKSEHIERYEATAQAICAEGYAVIGHDHLGHGDSLVSEADRGFFAAERGGSCLLKDIHRVTYVAKHLYPDVPLFMLGHSMGSFLVRRYMTIYPGELAGVIIMGTGSYSEMELKSGYILSSLYCKVTNDHFRSRLVEGMAMNPLKKGFGTKELPGTWLSANLENSERFAADPRCGFPLTVGAFRDFIGIMKDVEEEKNMDRVPRGLPILLLSGMDDPLGGFTMKVLKVYNRYVQLGMEDTDVRFYQGDRHEILNELDAEDVRDDIISWMDGRL